VDCKHHHWRRADAAKLVSSIPWATTLWRVIRNQLLLSEITRFNPSWPARWDESGPVASDVMGNGTSCRRHTPARLRFDRVFRPPV